MDVKQAASKLETIRWSTDKPEDEGYYWYREQDIHDIVRVYSRLQNESLIATGAFYEQSLVDEMNGFWAGPIPSPSE